jgi:RimJ/RimL family protein N-acetyltransferase
MASSLCNRKRPACPAADVYGGYRCAWSHLQRTRCTTVPVRRSASHADVIRAVLAQSVSNFEEALVWNPDDEDKGVDALIGFCGLRRVQDLGEVEILYALTESRWKHGYAFEIASAIIHYAFERAGLDQIVGITDVPNVSSPTARRRLRYARLTRWRAAH